MWVWSHLKMAFQLETVSWVSSMLANSFKMCSQLPLLSFNVQLELPYFRKIACLLFFTHERMSF